MRINSAFFYLSSVVSAFLLLACGGGGGGTSSSQPINPPIIDSFTADSDVLVEGQFTKLSWSVSGANSLSLDQGIGQVIGNGRSITPTETHTYTLTAVNDSGSTTAQITVAVEAIPKTATYYIDYEMGDDGSAGTGAASPWKHAPGDPAATGNPKNVALNPGNVVLFKGGVVYRGTIQIPSDGQPGFPIVYRGEGWGSGKAVIDGTEPFLGSWQACASAADCGGNPSWQHISWSSYTGTISPFTQFFENGERVYLAQTPNMTDPFWDDRFSEYLPVAVENITATSITDAGFFNQADSHAWDGASIQIWVQPNVIVIQKVTGFNPTTHTIQYENLDSTAIYGDRGQYYSLVNHISALDRPGEIVVDEAHHRIYYWPLQANGQNGLSLSVRGVGISTGGHSHVIIDGFAVRGFSSDDYARGIVDGYISGPATDVIVQNNEVSWIRTKNGRQGSIAFSHTNNLVVVNNFIHDCQRNSGILVGGQRIRIHGNTIRKAGYKGIWSIGSTDLRVTENDVSDCSGTHGNPVSIFTSKQALAAHNRLWGTSEILTFEDDQDLMIHGNLICGKYNSGQELGSSLLRENGDRGTGYHVITNNTILYSGNNAAIGIGAHAADPGKLIVCNNIADGGAILLENQVSHNLYTGLFWQQKASYGWQLREGEMVEKDLTKIFVDHLTGNYQLIQNSPARDAGIGLYETLPSDCLVPFNDFNFAKDMVGQIRGRDGHWDLGALEGAP